MCARVGWQIVQTKAAVHSKAGGCWSLVGARVARCERRGGCVVRGGCESWRRQAGARVRARVGAGARGLAAHVRELGARIGGCDGGVEGLVFVLFDWRILIPVCD